MIFIEKIYKYFKIKKIFAEGPEKGSGCSSSCCYYEDRQDW